MAASPDRAWGAVTPSAADPYRFVNANPYPNDWKRFSAQVSYEVKDLVFEGGYRHGALERTYREAASGERERLLGGGVWRSLEWVNFRGSVEQYKRSAKGWNPATSVGLQSDEAEKETNRVGLTVELMPIRTWASLSRLRKNDDYPNRPLRVAGVPGTESGLLEAKYDGTPSKPTTT